MPRVDFTGVSDGFEAIPAGLYEAVLDEWEYKEKTATAKGDYIKTTFRITEGEYEGRKLFKNFSMLRDSLWSYKKSLVNLGVDPDELAGSIDTDEIMPDVVQNPCVLRVSVGEYDGKPSNNVDEVLSPDVAAFRAR